MTNDEHLSKMPALAISRVIQLCEGITPLSERPLLTFLLSHGQRIKAVLVSLAATSQQVTLLVTPVDEKGNRSDDLMYIDQSAISALTLHRASTRLTIFSEGKLDPLHFTDSPSELSLKRSIGNCRNKINSLLGKNIEWKIDWKGSPIDNSHLRSCFKELIDVLGATFVELVVDDFTKNEIAGSIDKINCSVQSNRSVKLSEKVLSINIGEEGKVSDRYSIGELTKELSKQL